MAAQKNELDYTSIIVPSRTLESLLGVKARTIRDLADKGIVKRDTHGKYFLFESAKGYITALKVGLKWVLYDRIRYLGQRYISDGKVDFDDRRILNEMHKSYHEGLSGNGDLDNLMAEVNRLPLE